ncbi:protein SICKLE isoform X2 [Magnolia sinica]|uniref:protein SICKLE isoform X2 n=1 Tax=Magnolia sinica TaxID=86752 RepID=UPI0026591990|nr:protein SICKLE isoform X2 [Magnolia sinica]
MDESEKRRERLKAMRTEAAQAQVSDSQGPSTPSASLSNPLLDPSVSPSTVGNSPAVPRFDFYTDPMSAYPGNKRRSMDNTQSSHNNFSPSISSCSSVGPRNPNASPVPTHQFQMNYANPNASPVPTHQFQMNYANPNASPVPTHQFQMNYAPDPRINETPPPHMSAPWRSPIRMTSQFSGHGGTPGNFNRSGGPPSYGLPPNSSRGGLPSPGYGRGCSPSSNSGRGSYHRFNNSPSPGSGRSGGRGRGFHGSISARDQPMRFYHKSMVEDPWRFLKPVVGTLVRSWLPKSVSMKKARVLEAPVDFNSQSSLADCLTLSLEEAVNDVTNI